MFTCFAERQEDSENDKSIIHIKEVTVDHQRKLVRDSIFQKHFIHTDE